MLMLLVCTVVVAFRGTKPSEITNWLEDLNIFSSNKAFPWYLDAQVHPGFLGVLESHEPFLIPTVPNLMKQYPDYQVVIVGHSLGGAIATLFSMQLFAQYGITSSFVRLCKLPHV
jgi:alpha-beta hydrolase superfamily lysophospholipase